MKPMLHKVEWPTLLFFGSLFVVVGGLEKVGIISMIARSIAGLIGQNMVAGILLIAWTAALGSAVIDNIPLVATFLPIVFEISQITGLELKPLLWALSLGTCMGAIHQFLHPQQVFWHRQLPRKLNIQLPFSNF